MVPMIPATLLILLAVFPSPHQAAPSKKCTYSFTVDEANMAAATCGTGSGKVQSQGVYGAGYDLAGLPVDKGTARQLLMAVTKLIQHQNVVSEVTIASKSIQELKAELISQQEDQEKLVARLVELQSNMELAMSARDATLRSHDHPFTAFTGLTNRHAGCPEHHPERIHEMAPIRSTSNHLIKIMPRSCHEWRQQGYRNRGLYTIDPDGLEGQPPFSVECEMSPQGGDTTTIIIHHNHEARTHVIGYEDHGSYVADITYRDVSRDQLAALTSSSHHCEQLLRWECKGASIRGESWWLDFHGERQTYWGGGGPVKGCACFLNDTCVGRGLCNCDANDDKRWLEDSGMLTNKSGLPVSRLLFGDTGSYHEEGYYTLGPLRCYSTAANPYNDITAFMPVRVWPPFNVFCDYDGWLVIQRKSNQSAVDFDQNWDLYRNGFGNFRSDFWLGLEKLYQLTNQNKSYTLMISFDAGGGIRFFAQYVDFKVSSEDDNYRLFIGQHSGTVFEELHLNNGMAFTTQDRDNDGVEGVNCAEGNGGWWFANCGETKLNAHLISWGTLRSIKSVEMKMRLTEHIS